MKNNAIPFLVILLLVLAAAAFIYWGQERGESLREDDASALAPPPTEPVEPVAVEPDLIAEAPAVPAGEEGRKVLVWISIDGLRPDYLDRAETPFFDRFMKEGAWSKELKPVFPSLTFPSHVSQATGVKPEAHGITKNSFYDAATRETHRYPGPARLLEAEPIWITAQRQDIPTGVLDWPLSHEQDGPIRTLYFGDRFIPGLSDRDRLGRVLDMWRDHDDNPPLQLVMGYIVGPDSPGHRFGPDAPEMTDIIRRVDGDMAWFLNNVVEIFEEKMGPEDKLYVMITTDHGMSQVEQLVNLPVLLDAVFPEGAEFITGGNVASIHLEKLPEEQREAAADAILEAVEAMDFAQAWRREDLPEKWGYQHPKRVGDVVVVLDAGHTFSRQLDRAVYPVEDGGGPFGMHGYDPRGNPEMLGWMGLWRYPKALGGYDLGPVDSLQLHPSVARLFGIEPAAAADAPPIELSIEIEEPLPD